MKNKNILVAPLDWGLGHATRCIPVIKELISNGCIVSIATSGSAFALLKSEFPSLKFIELTSYRAKYSERMPFMTNVLLQLPKFLNAIRKEKKVVQKIADEHAIDIIISDNRYGCRSENTTSVFIGHQLHIIMPFWLKWLQPIVNYFNRQYIKKFDVNWIPDFENDGYAGRLSHPGLTNSRYVGVLSRFTPTTKSADGFELAVILSGPEPQRTLLEKMVITQLGRSNLKAIIVRGLPGATSLPVVPGIAVANHLSAEKLQAVMANSSVILARSGYSTVMDLSRLGKKAIFIPTPGQTEQEYLAQTLMSKGVAFCQKQKEFDLAKALKEVKEYKGFTNDDGHKKLLVEAIQQLIK
ncbi:MAG: glycosyltransferase [Cyclobacteriaceae bacterium]